jgi:mRNA interferase RelE/StbE
MVRLAVSKKVDGLIRKMHPDLKKSVRASLGIILAEPESGKLLVEELAGLRSFRVKTFRIIYRIKEPETIEIVAIGPRDRIYEETFRLIRKERGE